MTGQELRELVIEQCEEWIGSGKSRKQVVEAYNADKPLEKGYKVKTTDALCAASVTAVHSVIGITGYSEFICKSCGANRMAEYYRTHGTECSREEAESGDIFWWKGHIGFFVEQNGSLDRVIDMQSAGLRYRNYRARNIAAYYKINYDAVAALMDGKQPEQRLAEEIAEKIKTSGLDAKDVLNRVHSILKV